jgi:tRNA-dihydrouridine synthase
LFADLNLGCPQRVAFQGHFGSFLLDEVDRVLVLNMVRTIAENSIVPIFVKIRLLDKVEDTLKLCQQLMEAGASLIAIHGRYRVNLVNRTGPGARDGPAHLDQIQYIRQRLPSSFPLIANGNIINWDDCQNNLTLSSCNGIMSAEGLLDNPALFNNGVPISPIRLAKEYLDLVKQYPVKLKTLIFHIRRMCKDDLNKFQLMEACLSCNNVEEMEKIVRKMEHYHHDPSSFHFDKENEAAMKKRIEAKKAEESKRKQFEERMMRKAKREKLNDLYYYLSKGAEIPTAEIIEDLKKLEKDKAFEIWKEKHSQHCWNYHFNVDGCSRDRGCPFLHTDPKYMEETVYG